MEFCELLIPESTTVTEALKKLDITAKRVLFVVNNDRLVAALSDGDIRRWILKHGDLSVSVSKIANYNPKFVNAESTINTKEYMIKHHIEALPVVDDNRKIIDIAFLYSDEEEYSNDFCVPIVIMAGGKGTRLYPYTKILPKPLIPIGEIPISEHIINNFYKQGCKDFTFIVNYKKNMIKAYFNEIEKDYSVSYADETTPLGTGGGLSLLRESLKETFLLTNCDTMIKEDFSKILKAHYENKNLITMICSLRNYQVPYGVVEIGNDGDIDKMIEKPTMSFFTNTGTYIVEPEVLNYIDDNTYIGFPDVVQKLKDMGKKVGVYPINERAWLDMGQFDTMKEMKDILNIED